MDDERPWYDDVGLPACSVTPVRPEGRLCGRPRPRWAARTSRGSELCPRVDRPGRLPLSEIIDHLGVSKQAAGQLVDTLALRGYLDRPPIPTTAGG